MRIREYGEVGRVGGVKRAVRGETGKRRESGKSEVGSWNGFKICDWLLLGSQRLTT